MKLKIKLPLILVPLLITPMLLVSVLAFESMRSNAKESLIDQMSSLIKQITVNEQSVDQTFKANSILFSGSTLLKNYLFTPPEERYRFALLPLMNLFASYHKAYIDYEEIKVVLPDGFEDARFAAQIRDNKSHNDTNNGWFQTMQKNKVATMSTFQWDEDTGEPRMIVAHRLMFVDPTMEDSTVMPPSHRGYLVISSGLKRLKRQIENTAIGKMGGILIIDDEGRSLYPEAQKITIANPKDLLTTAHSAIKNNNTEMFEIDNNKLMIRVSVLPGGLILVAYLPEQELIQAGTELRHKILIWGIILVMLSSGLLMLALQFFIVKPLNRLGEGAEAIGSGKLETQLTVNSKDEVALLARQFNNMAKGLMESRKLRDEAQSETLKLKEASIESLQAADRLKDEFLANTSHELRTPLHGITGLAESLQKGVAGPMSASAHENLSLIIASGNRLSNLVNDILDFSKLKHKELKLALRPVHLHGACNLVVSMIRVIAEPKGLLVENRIPVDFPAVMADENRLYQILYNLVGNAVKFTPSGHVAMTAFVVDNMVSIQVEDSGIGIPESEREVIFQSFEQLDSGLDRVGSGTGLGLAITKQLVESHGGEIQILAREGGGSVFSFTMPKADIKQRVEDISAPLDVAREMTDTKFANFPIRNTNSEIINPIQGKKEHILVVDDEVVNLRVIENYLSINGYIVSTALSSSEALAKIAQNKEVFDLILLDVMMPGESGFKMCEKLRRTYSYESLPVIFLTALTREGDLEQGFSVGGNDYIPKPFGYAELLARINLHLSLSRQSRDLHDMNAQLEKRVEQRTQALERAYDYMERLANLDGLTGVNNRRALDLYLENECSKSYQTNNPLCCVMIDIDYFKLFNDTYGHQDGDACLSAIVQYLRGEVEKYNGFIARYGGEEFCLCLNLSLSESVSIIQDACRGVMQLHIAHVASDIGVVTISAGVAFCTEATHSPEKIIAAADKALYEAKHSGRNCVKAYREEVTNEMTNHS